MNRRSFLLGTLITGVAFTAHSLIQFGPEAPKIILETDRLKRWLRAFRLPYHKLMKFKIAYNHTDGYSYGMPEVDQCLRLSSGTMQFMAPKLNIVNTAIFTGVKVIDDENYILMDSLFVDGRGQSHTAHVACGDELNVTAILNLTIEKGK